MDLRPMPSRDEVRPRPEPAEPLRLGDYVALVWRFKVLLVAAAIIAAVTMFTRSISGPRVYESTVTFAATQSKIGDGGQTIASTAALRPMVESLTTAAAVIHDVGLDKPPNNMRPAYFLDSIVSVDEVRGTNLITVKVNYPDPTLAATIANSVADHAVQTARRVSGNEASHARDLIKEQLDLALKQLDAADLRLREYRQQARVEAVRKDVESRLGGPQSPVFSQSAKTQSPVLSGARAQSPVFPGARVPSVGPPSQVSVSLFLEDQPGGRPGLTGLLARIASEKARLVAMEAELAKRNRVDATTKSVDEVYQGLDAAAATTRSNLASLEQEKVELMGSRKLDSGTMAVLDHLYAIESDLARRQVDRDLAEANYVDLSQRYQEASLQVIGRSAEFVVIDPAVPADRPVPRHVARNTVVAAVAGFCLALAGVLLWHAAVRSQYVVR